LCLRGNEKSFATKFASYIKEIYPQIYNNILETKNLDDSTCDKLKACADEFKIAFLKSNK